MDGVEREGVDLLETLTSKPVEGMGERSLFDDMEDESAEAAVDLTTTAPMMEPSTMAPVLEMTSPGKADSSSRKVTFVAKLCIDLAFDEKSGKRMAYLSEPFHWYGADWTVLLHRHNGDLSGSNCYVGVEDTSSLPADFEFRGKARIRIFFQ